MSQGKQIHKSRRKQRSSGCKVVGIAVFLSLWASGGLASITESTPAEEDVVASVDDDVVAKAEETAAAPVERPLVRSAEGFANALIQDAIVEVHRDEGTEQAELHDSEFVGPPVPTFAEVPEPESERSSPPVAANIDLSQPVTPTDGSGIDIGPIVPPVTPAFIGELQPRSLVMLGAEVAAGTSTRLSWSPEHSFAGIAVPTPVLVVNGAKPGPVLCITAAIHGDELNGIEVVRRVLYDLEPEKLSGAVVGVPIVNLQGFRNASRYLPDRRDLNRFFPGNPKGSSASRLAHSFFTEVISNCSALVDLHTGSFQRTNLPQLRADLENPQVVELTRGFGSTVVLDSRGSEGTLRSAASNAGIPTVTLEAGGPARVQDNAVTHSTKGVMTLLNELGMYKRVTLWGHREPVYYRSKWIRADRGGVLFSKVELGERVAHDQLLGTITDPITNVRSELRASVQGRILGMALDQFVMPGFAAFRIGIEKPEEEVSAPTAIEIPTNSAALEKTEEDRDSRTLADNDMELRTEHEEMPNGEDSLEDSE